MKSLKNQIIYAIVLIAICGSMFPVTIATAASSGNSFTDVPKAAYYREPVNWAVQNGITSGVSKTSFAPSDVCTRAQTVTFLWRSAGSPKPSGSNPFRDVSKNSYYYDSVLWAVEQGITTGVTPSTFEPDAVISRAQAVCFLYRYEGTPMADADIRFSDVASASYYADAVRWAVKNGITNGTSATTFSPVKSCTRAEIVTLLYRCSNSDTASDEEEIAEVPVGISDADGAKAAIINGFLNLESPIDVSNYNIETSVINEMAAEIADIDGENYYYISRFMCYENDGEMAQHLFVWYKYNSQEEVAQHRKADADLRAKVEDIVSSVVQNGMSEYETAKVLHDYIALNCAYDMRYYSGGMPSASYTAYGVLMDNIGVCAGYARAYQKLLQYCGIECEYVTGYANGGRHAWNIVKIDGEWYNVDVTWDDPTPDRKGYVRYNYFLRSDAVMARDHNRKSGGTACTCVKYDSVTLLDSKEQEREKAIAAENARLDAVFDDLMTLIEADLSELPYTTKEELQAADNINAREYSYPEFDLPKDRFTYSDLSKLKDRINQAIIDKYPDYELSLINSEKYSIQRNDVLAELKRRKEILEAAAAIHVPEIEAQLQKAILEGGAGKYYYVVTEDYTQSEIRQACDNMSASDYTFEDYTAEDFRLVSYQYSHKVWICNYKWAEEKTQSMADIIETAIKNGETIVEFPAEDNPDVSSHYYASIAASRVKAAGYTFDGLTSGVDYTISRTYIKSNGDLFTVVITYPEPHEDTEPSEETEQNEDTEPSEETEQNEETEPSEDTDLSENSSSGEDSETVEEPEQLTEETTENSEISADDDSETTDNDTTERTLETMSED